MSATGTEARVCEMIASRQRLGIAKYGQTVANNPLALRQWLQAQNRSKRRFARVGLGGWWGGLVGLTLPCWEWPVWWWRGCHGLFLELIMVPETVNQACVVPIRAAALNPKNRAVFSRGLRH